MTAARLGFPRALAATVALVGALALPAALRAPAAHASRTMETSFQDDNLLVYGFSASTVGRTLDTLRDLGVDRLRISVFWNIVAPDALSHRRPAFDAADPAAYPPGSWDRYDRLVALARQRGMDVNFDITSPAPYWATGRPSRPDLQKNWEPSPAAFGQFVHAVGERYSGTYVPPGSSAPVPRVSYWSVWNEPNQGGWLSPQWVADRRRRGRWVPNSPALYRSLVDAAVSSLVATGHTGPTDTILIGETAPKGLNVQGPTRAMKPLPFLRSLYCLDAGYRPLRGAAATAQACPARPSAPAFVAAHPGLFYATGYAHHPYELTFAPDQQPGDRDYVTIANLPVLTGALARATAAWRFHRAGPMPLYLTEYGYQTDPPDPLGVSLAQQAAYLDQSSYIAYNNPNVTTLSQFLLVDDPPVPGVRDRVAAYGRTFQSGLELRGGRRKPSFGYYRVPIYVPIARARRGGTVRVWGMARPGPREHQLTVDIQFQAAGSTAWSRLATVQADPTRGFVDVRVRVSRSGSLRLSWQRGVGSGQVLVSRPVAITVS